MLNQGKPERNQPLNHSIKTQIEGAIINKVKDCDWNLV
jgi:hypothetical protein